MRTATPLYRAVLVELERRRQQLGWPAWKLDDISGVQDGYSQVDRMMADIADAAETLKAIVSMLDTAYLRVLASASARLKADGTFKGVDNRPTQKRPAAAPRKRTT